ncbi:MAG: outer membrane protein assembly factor BamA [Alphaproteobacteria bacterium]|nr:outer membrane protein assembly factor BamA [Alphaproteobacteria bacterium]
MRAAALGIALALSSIAIAAPSASAQVVSEIRVEGTQRIDPDTVRSYLLVKPGDTLDADRLDQALKALFATGLFADVSLTREGTALVAKVVENPIINRIQFEGNKRVSDDLLNQEVQLRPRVVYTRTKVQSDVKRVLDLYRRSGRFAATVEPKVIELPQNRVDLVFEINEGDVTAVRKIAFVGNQRFSESRLRDVVNTKESRWYRFLSTSDTYDPDRLSFDRELLRKFYLGQGYADFRVVSGVAELTPDREAFYVTFTVDEGERYRFGTVEVVSRLKDLKPEALKGVVTTSAGAWYDADKVDGSIQALTDQLGSLGYAFVDVRPRVTRDREQKTISVTYEIQEGPRVYVDRINIIGNVRTLDKVVRRELKLAEGDAFNTAKLRRSRQRVRNLGYFEKVDVTNVPGETPDRTVVNVEVQEKSTGEISFGVGFSTADGPLGDIRLRERNLLGRGQDLTIGLLVAGKRQEIDLSFDEPYFLDTNIGAGFDLFRLRRDFQREANYDVDSMGGAIRARYQLSEFLRHTVRYTLRSDTIENISGNASRFIREQKGTYVTSGPGYDLLYDRRDDRFDPTDGYFIRFSQDLAGFGGDSKWLRNRVAAGFYYAFTDDWVGNISGEAGYLFDFNEPVRINQRFFVGGENLRGFRSAGIGPRDRVTGDTLGGKEYAVGSIGVSFPTGLPKEVGIRGFLFSDFGTLRNTDSKGSTIADTGSIRVSAGVGFSWRSPFGPLRLSFAFPVIKEDFDKREIFRFSFGSRF